MSSKARGLADLGNAFNDGALSNRNKIINGAMQVWQRGTSFGAVNAYTVDRWYSQVATTTARSSDVPSNLGFQYSAKFTFATGGDPLFQQKIENGIGIFSNQTVTLSYYAKAAGNITKFDNVFFINDTVFSVIHSAGHALSTSWERYSITVTMPAYTNSFAENLAIRFDIDPTQSGDVYITGVQLEAGDAATPFEHRSYGQELALCQRYYNQTRVDIQTPTGGYMIVPVYFKTTMRAAPTTTNISAGSTAGGITSQNIGGLRADGAYFQVQSSANSNYILGRIDEYSAEL